jgi:hypothetical protein
MLPPLLLVVVMVLLQQSNWSAEAMRVGLMQD